MKAKFKVDRSKLAVAASVKILGLKVKKVSTGIFLFYQNSVNYEIQYFSL